MASSHLSRRALLHGLAGVGIAAAGWQPRTVAQTTPSAPSIPTSFTAPIGWAGQIPGDGFRIGHGFACENTWFNRGWWHTGEDWYAVDRDSSDAVIYAVAAGEVVYVGFDYPGRVIIVRHADDLFSAYGHLDFATAVREGQSVAPGDTLGTVLLQIRRRAPSHLHFELRTFLTTPLVNGSRPSHGVKCGTNCPPGPGYWPITAPEHPTAMGWRNPTHQQVKMALDQGIPDGLKVRPQSAAFGRTLPLHAEPDSTSKVRKQLTLDPDDTFTLRNLSAGDPASTGTSAEAYGYWLRIARGDEFGGWVQAAIPSDRETGSDGRPSSLDRPFLLVGADGITAPRP